MTPDEPHFEFRAEELQRSLDFLREGIQILSPQWRYLYVNEAVARHGRTTRAQLLGRTMQECYPGIEHTHMFSVLETCMMQRTSAHLENEFEYEDGQRAWFELRIEPCTDGLIVLSLDITERKQVEEALRQSHKLRALGQMAGSIAHDLNNALNPIMLQTRTLHELVEDPRVCEIVSSIEAATRIGVGTVERLRNFSRQETDRPAESTELAQMAELAVQICLPRVRARPEITLLRELSATSRVLVRPSELVNAIVNLVMNAVDALGDRGTITVRTGADDGAWVEVVDDGPGMPPEVEGRVLEPFFTTKPEGTGLGLAMVYAFTKRHGGLVHIDTEPGRGTTMKLWFPAAEESSTQRPAKASAPPGSRRLLVVEDDALARSALEVLLVEEGFVVETAACADEALTKASQSRPDALIVDFRLPDLNGVILSRRLREQQPDLPVVIMSGFDETHTHMTALLREPRVVHVAKPVDLEQLVTRLVNVLGVVA